MTTTRRLFDSTVEYSTLVELLRWRAQHQPDRQAYTFLVDGEMEEVHLTYQELDWQARAIGARLQSPEAVGERALLLYPPGLEYIAGFFGCLYAGSVAVPAYPPDPTRLNRTLPRLQAIVADAQATVALTTAPILAMAEMLFDQSPGLKALRWLATDDIVSDLAEEWQEPRVSGDTLTFLQYTSGSTAAPKGVMLTHHNLLPAVSVKWPFIPAMASPRPLSSRLVASSQSHPSCRPPMAPPWGKTVWRLWRPHAQMPKPW